MATTIDVIAEPGLALEQEIRDFLARLPPGRACIEQDPRWLAILRDAMGHRTMAIVARDHEDRDFAVDGPNLGGDSRGPIVGYLPLALVSSRLFGRFLVSLPYVNRAGAVANDPAVAAKLVDRAALAAAGFDAQYLELRQTEPLEHAKLTERRDEKVRMVLDLPGDAERLWGEVDTKVRNQVRKGDKNGLTIAFGGADLVDEFYTVFAVNMRDVGTPVYPRKLFQRIMGVMEGEAELAVVRVEGQAIAGALLLHDPLTRQSLVPSASCLRQFNSLNANMWMYHRLLTRAIERGSETFDFGRSSVDSGTYRFKKQWGAQPHPTVWQYHLRRGDIDAVRPNSPRYQRKIEAWQKLPVWVTRLVGPSIVRGIP
ncbi:MAG: FemAB family PEP-CTERM system-associated protein [Planctomycetota bacterium]|nr:FemAB family PEP-CTERM system-associated protein [Planctomycetota bacterium]